MKGSQNNGGPQGNSGECQGGPSSRRFTHTNVGTELNPSHGLNRWIG